MLPEWQIVKLAFVHEYKNARKFLFQNFIRRCLTYHKEDRPDVLELAHDDYLKPPLLKNR